MRKPVLFAAAILLGAAPVAHAGNLDAPVEHKITNRTEISRGADAAGDCFSKAISEADGSPVAYSACIEDTESAETRANTRSKPFDLGLDIAAVIDMNIFAKHNPDYAGRPSFKTGLDLYRKEISQVETELGISNDDACRASGKTLEICQAAAVGMAH